MKKSLVPGGEELYQLVGLVVQLHRGVQLLLGHVGQVAGAPAQAEAGGGGGGAQARVRDGRCLALPQEVKPSTWNGRGGGWLILGGGRHSVKEGGTKCLF